MLCFAVFLGSWSPLSTTGISLPSLSNPASKGAVDYSTPSGKEQLNERGFDNTGVIAVPWDETLFPSSHISPKRSRVRSSLGKTKAWLVMCFLGGMRSI